MNVAQISRHVHYIGVNDRTLHRFESLWPLPLGVSYNSYLVTGGDKIAVIDGVEAGHALKQIEHINRLTDGRAPDYLVINHMEPDHSGAISLLLNAYPDMVIVGNTQTVNMVAGYYGIEAPTMTVKDGDTLPLGGDVALSFHFTPMVHWPETMMTFLACDGVLFSGDGFGCFGALNGAVVDTDMDATRYFPEMIRYYSAIVGKYGRFVQRALTKLKSLEISTLAPTHGPVWRERMREVGAYYDRMSRYEPFDNGVTIVYGSMYGNTELMVEEAAATLAARGVKDIAVHNAAISDLSYILADIFTHKGLIIASPTYSETLFPPIKSVVDALVTRGMKDRVTGLIGGHTWAPQAVKVMDALLQDTGMEIVSGSVSFKQAPSQDALAAVRELASAIADRL